MIDLTAVLRERGYRMTEPRRQVWDALSEGGGHQTALEIAARAGGTELSSVYRALALFAELGLVRESQLGVDGSSRWEVIHSDDHIHLVCHRCGSVNHHEGHMVERTRSHLADDHGFTAASIELVATGLCADCSGS